MKKWFDIAVLAVLVGLTACTKVESTPEAQETISFAVGSYAHATKAEQALGTGDYAGITSFKSSAWLHAQGAAAGTAFFTNETISKTGSTWEPALDYFWPKHPSSYINFVSWYSTIAPDSGYPTEDEIRWTVDTDLASNAVILLAEKAWEQKTNVTTYFTSGVPTLFHHMLTEVIIKVKSGAVSETESGVTTTWALDVSNFKIENVYKTGTLALTNTVAPASAGTTTWTTSGWDFTGKTKTDMDVVTASTRLTSDFTTLLASSVLPQSISGISLSFDYAVETKTTNGTTTNTLVESGSKNGILLSSFEGYNGDWEMNKKITYSITINPKTGAITITPTVEDVDFSLLLNVE